jgi:hypothetical protein
MTARRGRSPGGFPQLMQTALACLARLRGPRTVAKESISSCANRGPRARSARRATRGDELLVAPG